MAAVELAMLEHVAERRAGGLSLARPAPVGRPEPPMVLTSDMVKVGYRIAPSLDTFESEAATLPRLRLYLTPSTLHLTSLCL